MPFSPSPDNPWIRFDQSSASLFAGGSYVFKCRTWGIPSPSATAVKWMRNGQELKDGDFNGTISIGGRGVVGLITHELHFYNVDSVHDGNYTCESRNKYYTRRRNLRVLVSCKFLYYLIFIMSIRLTCLTFKAQPVLNATSGKNRVSSTQKV